jgi:hypothetical protein
MSFIHYLFLGHFEHEGETVRLSKSRSDPVYKPVVRRPIDTEVIKAVLQEHQRAKVDELAFPDDWAIWKEDGYLVCDKYTRNPEAIDFVARLVERTRCDIYDVAAHSAITLREWLAVTHGYTRS